ncbi:PREDICTED: uncharacterized protein LOC104801216 isoform X2 [Tarenaya hassleriana]|uniref:uncharacterized protein LOC104801216 isoform X2 n=1 Tax=Tarenaya hassleriana TaxID=28532 RepID=UPI00053C7589|nr:PREDICTED: uncharacterized protein LOC104801216 isoform X2 [Tarenaya hassleriana]
MNKLCLMAFHGGYPTPALGLRGSEIIKSNGPYLVNLGTKQEIIPARSINLKPDQSEPWKPAGSMCKLGQLVEIDSSMMRPLLVDVHDTPLESLPFSLRISEQCARQEQVTKFLMLRSDELKEGGFDMSLLSDFIDPHALKSGSHLPEEYSVLYLNQKHGKPLLDLVEKIVRNPEVTVHPDGQVLVSGSREDLKDVLSIAAEFYLSRNYARGRTLSPLVPQFPRLDSEVIATLQLAPAKLEAVTKAPLKSPEITKLKPSPKKHNTKKGARERDLYRRNHLHACESLLSLMIGNDEHKKTTILSLKRSSSTDLSELLTQLSIGISGTGIAVLFSVVCSVATGHVPFCADKFFSTGLGFTLVWLSWAVNKLRDTIVHVNRKAMRPYSILKDQDLTSRLEKSTKEVYSRAAAVMAMLVLRFA